MPIQLRTTVFRNTIEFKMIIFIFLKGEWVEHIFFGIYFFIESKEYIIYNSR